MPERPIALITGATSGIGLAIARKFAANQYDLIVHGGRNQAKLDAALREFENEPIECHGFLADFRSANWDQITDRAWNWQNRVDVLVNNAGVDLLTEQTTLDWVEKSERLWQVDVLSTQEISRRIGERMIASSEDGARV